MKIKVSAIQMSMSWDIEKNISKAISYVRDAAAKGANIILLPELFKTPYFCQKEKYDYFNLTTQEMYQSRIPDCEYPLCVNEFYNYFGGYRF